MSTDAETILADGPGASLVDEHGSPLAGTPEYERNLEENFRASPLGALQPGEALAAATCMARAHRRLAEHYRREYQMGHADAVAKADEYDDWKRDFIRRQPVNQLSWHDLNQLIEADPVEGLQLWESVKKAAWEAHMNGNQSAEALICRLHDSPWARAQHAAVLTELMRGWEPTNGVEHLLIEQMAMAHVQLLKWTAILTVRSDLDAYEYQDEGKSHWAPPRVHTAAAVQEAAGMLDRFHRMFLRTLRALRDMRRYSPVVVQNAGQVNVGQQQVNVAAAPVDGQESRA